MTACPDCGQPKEWEGAPTCGACQSARMDEAGLEGNDRLVELARIGGVPPWAAALAALMNPVGTEQIDDVMRRQRLREGRMN